MDELTYKYRGDPSIAIGVLGMVDNTLAIAECGVKSVEKNAVVNSFVFCLKSEENSVVLHFDKESKCTLPCPLLKVYKESVKKGGDHKVSWKHFVCKMRP